MRLIRSVVAVLVEAGVFAAVLMGLSAVSWPAHAPGQPWSAVVEAPATQPLPAPGLADSEATSEAGLTGQVPEQHLITGLAIPRITLQAEVVPARLVQRAGATTWEVPPWKVGHGAGTAGAGEVGTAVLLGHVSSRADGNVFQNLNRVRAGDAVEVLSGPATFAYVVVDVRTVARTDVSVLQPAAIPSVVLITCTGRWLPQEADYDSRLVVRASLADSPATAP
jgi:LPXTG-site transpeptidase (sortase) family protein